MSRIRGAIGIRSGEGRTVALVALLFAALEAGRGFGEVGVDTLLVSRLGAQTLPYLFVALGTTSLTISLAYGAALGRLPRIRLLCGILVSAAVALLFERLLMTTGHPATVPIAWLTVYAIQAISVTIVWTMAGSVFDARQAKRLFPLLTGAAIAGSFVGTLSSGPVAGAIGTESLVVLEALLLAVVGILVVAVARTTAVRVPPRRHDRSILAELRVGFDTVVRTPLMRLVALSYVLLAVLMFSVTYPFLLAASETFTDEAKLATALGLLSAAVTATSFVVSIGLANRIYARVGVAGAALLLPIVYLAGFSLWLVAFTFATAAIVRFSQQVTQRGVSNAAFSALYNVLPSERKAQVLAFNDGVPGQVGTILSGLLLLAAGSLLARDQVFWLGAITALVCTLVVLGIRRQYRASLMRTLRAGLGEQVLEGGPGLGVFAQDPLVAEALVDALGAPQPGVRWMAAELLGRTSSERAGPALIRAVDQDGDPSVKVAALEALGRLGGPPTAGPAAVDHLADHEETVRVAAIHTLGRVAADFDDMVRNSPAVFDLARDPNPAIRAAVACVLSARGPDPRSAEILDTLLGDTDQDALVAGLDAIRHLGDPRPIDRIRPCMVDPAPRVRIAAIAAVAGSAASDAVLPELIVALGDDDGEVRRAAASALAVCDAAPPSLIAALAHGDDRLCEAAILGLVGHGPAVRNELIDWTRGRVERAVVLRRARLGLRDADGAFGPPETVVGFLGAVLADREDRAIGLALQALAVLGAPEAAGVIRRTLKSSDPETRAQALEALETTGDRALSKALVGFLDDEAPGLQDREEVVSRLVDDGDRWISRLAVAAGDERTGMPDSSRTIGDLETMLALRRVPLFVGLAPEDLQRIAMTATEHVYPPGEPLIREGDLGDELVVIVEGAVRVVHLDADGTERVVRTYGAGDHIGELAVLRQAPRAAT
ncbi:MAG: HEAT repeat domain-containing protein, partial [Chloroflexota bacterium]